MGKSAAALLLVLAACLRFSSAVTWSVTQVVVSNLTNDFTDYSNVVAGASEPCLSPGVCSPFTVTIAPNTVWAWCGWKQQYQTDYVVKSTDNGTISTLLMQASEVFGCLIGNPPGIKQCGQIDTSLCDTKTSCAPPLAKGIQGLVFSKEACLLIVNNNAKSTTVTVRMNNVYSPAQHTGKVITILYTVIWSICMAAFMVISCTQQYKSPSHRISELLEMTTAPRVGTLPEPPSKFEMKLSAIGDTVTSTSKALLAKVLRTGPADHHSH